MKASLPITPDRDAFLSKASPGSVLPISCEFVHDAGTAVTAFQKLGSAGWAFLLESVERDERMGRYSFVGCDPVMIFEARGQRIRMTEEGEVREYEAEDPFRELEEWVRRHRAESAADPRRFHSGVVGYLGFDMVRFFEPTVPPPPPDALGIPDMIYMAPRVVVEFDHLLRRIRVVANAFVKEGRDPSLIYEEAVASIAETVRRLEAPCDIRLEPARVDAPEIVPESNTTQEEYHAMVREAQEYIRAGDIFQIVPSQRFSTSYEGDPLELYRALRFVNPSPYMFCLRFGGEFSLVGSSPEVHVRCLDGKVEIRPIAGTRPRGETLEADDAHAADLLADPKERAEHVMLVDLARNDVGRICEFGSVEVTDFMIIERYSHVMHIVSNVIGRLAPGRSAFDVMRATFPAGTVSGSPKVRAMQIINGFEKNKRCTYSGAVGYFTFDGNVDSCITLRSVVLKDGRAYVQAGGGVVADSTPEGEYQETINKARGMMRAIARAKALKSHTP